MGKINVLDKHIAELIAAGEVIERPCSVIKELVENSIDSGATRITVEIKNGGTTYMRVTDNGCGIMRDDISVAFLRHATSKVSHQDDLDNIGTLGFRGEALASICAVSRVELLTHSKDEEIGSLYIIDNTNDGVITDAGCPIGTTMIIRDLFYNVPARLKFLKKDVSEGNAISDLMDKIALSHPEISFIFIKDSKQIFKTAGDSNIKSAIYSVYGKEFTSTLIPVSYELDGIRINGYISKPEGARPNRNMQNFFINGRYIRSKTASVAIDEAAKGSVMVGKFLACVLHIQIAYSMVDVNVHPAKLEIRFVNEKPIFNAVYHAVKSALFQFDSRKQIELNSNSNAKQKPFESFTSNPTIVPKTETVNLRDIFPNITANRQSTVLRDSANSSQNINANVRQINISDIIPQGVAEPFLDDKFADDKVSIHCDEEVHNDSTLTNSELNDTGNSNDSLNLLADADQTPIRYIGEAFKTYIIAEKGNDQIILIDKHAAHERIIYEKLKNGGADIFEQGLLSPVVVTLNKIDYDSVLNNLDMFRQLHFDIEDFGTGNIIVRAVPQFLVNADISQTVIEIAGYLSDNKRDLNTDKMDWIFHNIACRSAVKAGNINTDKELTELAKRVDQFNDIRYCPHGRPVCVVLTKRQIEKYFGRV